MEKLSSKTEQILLERFGKDSLIALATSAENVPYVRTVDAFYSDSAFYVLTHALSGKMQQLHENPNAAIAGDWFTAHGIGEDLGYILDPQNREIAEQLKAAFAAWYSNGHMDEGDENTHILRIRLTDGVLFSHGTRYEW